MANDNSISRFGGMVPVQLLNGANVPAHYYGYTTSATAALYIGTPVARDANGRVVIATAGASERIMGSVIGFAGTDKAGLPTAMTSLTQASYLPANTDALVLVADEPGQEFLMLEDTGGSALTESAIGLGANIVFNTLTGDANTGRSTAQIDRSTAAASNTAQVLLLGLYDYVNTDGSENTYGNYAKWRVKVLLPQNAATPAGTTL